MVVEWWIEFLFLMVVCFMAVSASVYMIHDLVNKYVAIKWIQKVLHLVKHCFQYNSFKFYKRVRTCSKLHSTLTRSASWSFLSVEIFSELIAGLDYNENCSRVQATTSTGELAWSRRMWKWELNNTRLIPILVPKSYSKFFLFTAF